jgi:hypothetical protein
MTRLNTALLVGLVLACAIGANAADLIVDSAAGPYWTIQSAWNAAKSGDVIKVKYGIDGTYTEDLVFNGGEKLPGDPGWADRDDITIYPVDSGGVYAPRTVILYNPGLEYDFPMHISIINTWGLTIKGFEVLGYGDRLDWYGYAINVTNGWGQIEHQLKDLTLEDMYVHDCSGFLYARDWSHTGWFNNPGKEYLIGQGGMITLRNVELEWNNRNVVGEPPYEQGPPKGILGVYPKWRIEGLNSHDNGGACSLYAESWAWSEPRFLYDPGTVDMTIKDSTISYVDGGGAFSVGSSVYTADPDVAAGSCVIENCQVLYMVQDDYWGSRGFDINTAGLDIVLRGVSSEDCFLGLVSRYEYDHHAFGPTNDNVGGYPDTAVIPYFGTLTLEETAGRARNSFQFNRSQGVLCYSPVLTIKDSDSSLNNEWGFWLGETTDIKVYEGDNDQNPLLYEVAPPLRMQVENCTSTYNYSGGYNIFDTNGGYVQCVNSMADANGRGDGGWSGTGFYAAECTEVSFDDCVSNNAGNVGSPTIGNGFHLFNNVLGELRNCTATDCGGVSYQLERCVLASVDHCAALRSGFNGTWDNLWLYSGADDQGTAWPVAPPGLRAVFTNFVTSDNLGDNGMWVDGYHRDPGTNGPDDPGFDGYIDVVVRDSVISDNSRDYGIWLQNNCTVTVSHSDFWNNLNGDVNVANPLTCTYIAGPGIIHSDPMFTDMANNDLSLQPDSPCIGAGDPRDLDSLETRADMGCIDYADDPYPAKLMRETTRSRIWGFEMPAVGHSEFGIPFTPTGSANPNDMITKNGQPYNVNNRVYMWDSVKKTFLLFPLDFETLEVGQGYLYLNYFGARADQLDIEYAAVPVPIAGRVLIPEEGRSMIAIPNGQPLWQGDILVKNNGTGEIRTAVEDRAAAEHWLNWNWVYWSFAGSTYDIVGLGNDDEMVQPWYSYQLWAYQRDLTLIFPGG